MLIHFTPMNLWNFALSASTKTLGHEVFGPYMYVITPSTIKGDAMVTNLQSQKFTFEKIHGVARKGWQSWHEHTLVNSRGFPAMV